MARLTAAGRKKIPASKFAGPNRSFPVDTPGRVRAAKRFERYASPSTKKKIDAAARRDGIGSKSKTRRKSK